MNTPVDHPVHPLPLRSTLTAGMTIAGRYRLVSRIGDGGMGVVWSAINIFTDREVALKFISTPDPDEDLRRRLQREARACGALNHRNVIDVYDLVQADNGEPVLVMQLLQGETLADLLRRRRRLEPSLAAHIGRDIAAALAAIHDLKIVHRDLKPANIFLHQEPGGGRPIVKILDFGVSKRLAAGPTQRTAPGTAVGSMSYMSPEQIRAPSEVDPRADIWALGVVLFELLTGHRPFQGDISAILTQILEGEIPRVSRFVRHVDPGLVELVAGCLCRDRDQRLGPAERIAQALESFAGAGDPWSQPTPASERIAARSPAPSGMGARADEDDDDDATLRMQPAMLAPRPPAPPYPNVRADVNEDAIRTTQFQPPLPPLAPPPPLVPRVVPVLVGRIAPPPHIAGPASDAFGTAPRSPRSPLPSAPLGAPGFVSPRGRVAFFAAAAGLTMATGAGGASLVAAMLPPPRPPMVVSLEIRFPEIPRPAPPGEAAPAPAPSTPPGSGTKAAPVTPATGRERGGTAPVPSAPSTTPPPSGARAHQSSEQPRSAVRAAPPCESAKFLDRFRCTRPKISQL